MSEYPPGVQPRPGYFIARNRLVAGISQGLVVVEGTDKSGALTTAAYAAEQGKDVYAVPGNPQSPLAQAPLILLKQGAKLITTAQDILDEYGKTSLASGNKHKKLIFSQPKEEEIFTLLQMENELFVDDIAERIHVDLATVSPLLTHMEMEGLIKQALSGAYTLT